jgi:hypothetical protein
MVGKQIMKKKSKIHKNGNMSIKKESKLTKIDMDLLESCGLLNAIEQHKDLENRSYLLGMGDTIKVVNKLYGYKLRMYDFVPDIILYKDIERKMTKKEYKEFCKFMCGQTTSDKDGVYSWDLERFIRHLPCVD